MYLQLSKNLQPLIEVVDHFFNSNVDQVQTLTFHYLIYFLD